MSSQLSAHAITAHTAMTRISVSRCSTLPVHRGSASAEKCSTSFSTDIATLPSLIKGEPAQPVSPSEPARPFHALPLGVEAVFDPEAVGDDVGVSVQAHLEGPHPPDQVHGAGMTVMIGDILAQPAPERLHGHQIGAVAGQGPEVDPKLAGGLPDRHW